MNSESTIPPSVSKRTQRTPPMLAQYFRIKDKHKDCLLFFRLGDFYELFFDEAHLVARELGLTLTHRGQHQGQPVPMAGVPAHSVQPYLDKLVKRGFRIALCEQTSSSEKGDGKQNLLMREVNQIVTAGTLISDELLDAKKNNYLVTISPLNHRKNVLGLAWADISTGSFETQALDMHHLVSALARIFPREILIPESLQDLLNLDETLTDWQPCITYQPDPLFNSTTNRQRLHEFFHIASLDAFGRFTAEEVSAAGALIGYIQRTHQGRDLRISPPCQFQTDYILDISLATRRALELTQSGSGEKRHTLINVIDRTLTGGGSRLLRSRLDSPLTEVNIINNRLDAITWFIDHDEKRRAMRGILSKVADPERALTRLIMRQGGPRDLLTLRGALEASENIAALLAADSLPEAIDSNCKKLGRHGDLIARISQALVINPPLTTRDGEFILAGYSSELDAYRSQRSQAQHVIAQIEAKYRQSTGVEKLKIKHNAILGWFIEVPLAKADYVATQHSDEFTLRQGLNGISRFHGKALQEQEYTMATAKTRADALEITIFEEFLDEIRSQSDIIAASTQALAELDVAAALAELAIERHYVRPEIDDSQTLLIEEGRHAVLESSLNASFKANNCFLDAGETYQSDCAYTRSDRVPRLALVTGPNMAGKSTYLRQTALIIILAQMGSFVPAQRAHIGIVDRLFTRIGAADDLAQGRSTFMVEMIETAAILNQASRRSFVILDELGRGTATFDGLAIAWACLEHLHNIIRCRGLFATHFRELVGLQTTLDWLTCLTMKVQEWEDGVVFHYEVITGVATSAYGIHVAQLAGLPIPVLKRARDVMDKLEAHLVDQDISKLPLFALNHKTPDPSFPSMPPKTHPAITTLCELDPDSLSPREALAILYDLKTQATQTHS